MRSTSNYTSKKISRASQNWIWIFTPLCCILTARCKKIRRDISFTQRNRIKRAEPQRRTALKPLKRDGSELQLQFSHFLSRRHCSVFWILEKSVGKIMGSFFRFNNMPDFFTLTLNWPIMGSFWKKITKKISYSSTLNRLL